MCLIDTIDGALMLSLYIQPAEHFLHGSESSPSEATDGPAEPELPAATQQQEISRSPRDPVAFLYYSIVLTCLTVIVAIVVGVLQLLTLIDSAAEPEGKFWDGVEIAGEYYDVIGGAICGLFIVFGVLSVLVYPRWRAWVGRRYVQEQFDADDEGEVSSSPLPAETPGTESGVDVKHGQSSLVSSPV